jgi:outer membrane protein OmpA-like peptidoglycan-associated protein
VGLRNSRIALFACLAAGVAVALVMYYMAGPQERVILLPQADGAPSAVVVESKSGATAVLDRPYSVATVAPKRIGSEQTDETEVKTRYKELFDALPASPRVYTLYFETGGTRLTPESEKQVQLIVSVLSDIQDLPAFEITAIGHADEVGTDALNDELSRRRAAAVVSMLKTRGIDVARASVVGRGSREPLIPTKKGVAEARNRRVEIRLK